MKKKALSILLTAAMAVTLLAGCGSSSDNAGSTAASGDTTAESAAGSEAAAGSDKTVVNFYYSTDLEKVAQKEIEAFNTAHITDTPQAVPAGSFSTTRNCLTQKESIILKTSHGTNTLT